LAKQQIKILDETSYQGSTVSSISLPLFQPQIIVEDQEENVQFTHKDGVNILK
jgi:hypothetical protein